MAKTSPWLSFGTTTFTGTAIRDAMVTEEFNPLSITLPFGKLEVTLYSTECSIIEPTGDFALLQRRTPIVLYETVNGSNRFIGRFYLDDWENISDTLIKFICLDELGVLDSITYRGGIWLTPITMGALIDAIFTELDMVYSLDPSLVAKELTGWIPICSYREALQQIAFAAGAYVLCARQEGYIKIGESYGVGATTKGIRSGVASTGQSRVWQKRWRQSQWEDIFPDIYITASEKGASQSLGLRGEVTGVEVHMHDIVAGTGSKVLFEGTLAIGTFEIRFGQPMHTLSVTGATITESGANYAMLSVAVAGTVILSGLVYVDTVTKHGIYTSGLPEGTKQNVLVIEEATMVNSLNGVAIAQSVYDYYQERYVQKMKLYVPNAHIGRKCYVDTLYGRQIVGVAEKMTTDLARGFIAQTEIVGTVVEVT